MILWFEACPGAAQINFSNPIHITNKDGLPNSNVLSIEQDGEGFIWIGTFDGLCRFDGSEMKVFNHIPGDSTSFSNYLIKSIFYDQDRHCLWVGTIDGLNRLDLKTEKIKRYFHKTEDKHSLPDNDLSRTIFKDRQGDLWIGLERHGIVRYTESTDNFESFRYQLNGTEQGARLDRINLITFIQQDSENDSLLWIGTGSGFLKFNKFSLDFTRYYHDLKEERLNIPLNAIYQVYPLPGGRIILTSWGGFISLFDAVNETFAAFPATLDTIKFPKGNGFASGIAKKSDKEVWVTTKQGIVVFDHEQEMVTQEFLNDPQNNTYYRAHFLDNKGRVWGASTHGAYCYDPLHEQFNHYQPEIDLNQEDIQPVSVIQGANEDQLYVTFRRSKGVYLFKRSTNSWSVIPPYPSFFNRKPRFEGAGMIYLHDGRLLIVEESMLFTISGDAKFLVPFPIQPDDPKAKFIKAHQDGQGQIWVTSVNGGLFRLDSEKGTKQKFWDELLDQQKGEHSISIANIFEDSQNNIWISVSNGFSVFDSKRDTFLNFRFRPGKTNVFNHISNFVEDDQGRILISGGMNGIGIADSRHPEKGIISKLELDTNFPVRPNNLIKDAKGDIWFYDDKNLKRINLKSQKVETFDGSDGLLRKEEGSETVSFKSVKRLASGEFVVLYENRTDLSIFHPEDLQNNEELPRPYLTSFAVFDKELAGDSALFYRREIILPFNQNFFSFEFSAIGFTKAEKNTFRYKLEGLDQDWIYPSGNRRYASYSKVWEGEYTLRIMAANSEGIWNEDEYRLKIHILPPWHRTCWAYLLYTLALLSVGLLIYRFFKRRWMLKMELELEHAETLRLTELNEVKTKLYTNITHEFRTPLTVISGIADQVLNDPKNWFREGLGMIKRNSERLLNLVNQMLELRKLETGTLGVNMIQDDIVSYLRYLSESFHSYAGSKNIRLVFESVQETIFMDFDPDKIAIIVSNLLSNAIKFTPEGGKVKLHAELDRTAQGFDTSGVLQFCVEDTGIGIPSEKLPHIFDRFYQVDDTADRIAEGTGIGLALTKELVNVLNGDIQAESQLGEGTKLTVRLPISNKALNSSEWEPVKVKTWEKDEKAGTPLLKTMEISNANKPLTTNQQTDQPSILLIEDNSDVIRYLIACLQKDYELEVAYNGRQGIEKALDTIPDLIISDVMMPEMDGFEVCRILKKNTHTSHIPIILLTAKADLDSRLKGLERGADVYLAKPFVKSELLIRIRKLLELRNQLQQHYRALAGIKEEWLVNYPSVDQEERAFLENIRSLLQSNLTNPDYTIPQLCQEAGMSKSQLHRKLTALTGLSANRFMRSIRLAKAKALLESSSLSISQIAYETGFQSPDYFARLFHKEFGLNPSEFRKT